MRTALPWCTDRARAEAIDALRCTADLIGHDPSLCVIDACEFLGYGDREPREDCSVCVAVNAFGDALPDPDTPWPVDVTHTACLEAAARLEEGSWP